MIQKTKYLGRVLRISLSPSKGKRLAGLSFFSPPRVYSYRVMPFELKNASATYQRLVTKMFKGLIGRNVEAYVDDTIVKTKDESSHLTDLAAFFNRLRRVRMKLNTKKCVFWVSTGKFLGHIVNMRGIEANPKKVAAIGKIQQHTTTKQIQKLNGMLAALRRFISKSANADLSSTQ